MVKLASTDDLSRYQDELCILKICAEITIYWRGSVFSRAEEVSRIYRNVLQEMGGSFRYFETATMAGAKKLKKDSLDLIPFWMESKPRKTIYMLCLESGTSADETTDRSFYFLADEEDDVPIGALRISFPVDRMENREDDFAALFKSLLGDAPFESGHAGYGVNWAPRGDAALNVQETMASLAVRYQGIDFFDLDLTTIAMRAASVPGIKCGNWLTFVGTELTRSLGGTEALRDLRKAGVAVETLPNGALFRAGSKPLVGDQLRSEDMSEYAKIGKVLANKRFRQHGDIFASATTTADCESETQRWLSRFDH